VRTYGLLLNVNQNKTILFLQENSIYMNYNQRWAAPTPERPLHGASSAPGAERSMQIIGAGAERVLGEMELERSRSEVFFLAPIIAQFFLVFCE
jgi:hypothetical protein